MGKEFYTAKSVTEATLLKDKSCVFLAGGTEINRLNSGYEEKSLVSLKKLNLDFIELNDNSLKIGSMVTFQKIIDSSDIPEFLKISCGYMASRTKRNMATIGGNIASRRFDSYLIPTLVAAGAKLLLQNKIIGQTEVKLIDYVEKGSLYEDFLIVCIVIPDTKICVKSKRCSNTVLSHAFVTVALSFNGKKFNIYAGLKNSGFVSLKVLETCLNKKAKLSCDDVCELVSGSCEINFYDDIFGGTDYKKYILGVSIYELYSALKGENHED